MQSLTLDSDSPEQTRLVGNHLGQLAQRADVFLLTGQLGTGKTCLVQGIADGMNVTEYAFSPSFVIVRQYLGRLPLYHIDLYRLDCSEEVADLGLEDYFYGHGVCVVEWAEKGFHVAPRDNLLITLNYITASPTGRSIHLKPRGERYRALVQELRNNGGIVALHPKC